MQNKNTTKNRCPWVNLDNAVYVKYHDTEWGRPVHDDIKHFEMLTLEGAQAGLSWETILKKRENYRDAFAGFDPEKIAKFTKRKIMKLLADPGIVRNRLKINSTISNAKAFLIVQQELGSFDQYIWGFVNNKTITNHFESITDYPSKTTLSDTIAKDLKKRGFSFVGSTIIYAYMQAIGMMDDHTTDCWVRQRTLERWSVYMVLCHNDSLYTGITKNVKARFEEHCAQGAKTAKYLRGKGPLKLVYQEEVGSQSSALKIECLIKKLSATKKRELIELGRYESLLEDSIKK